MKPPIETIRLSQKAKDQLVELKKQTGIENWNTLCRWALCYSLSLKSEPSISKENPEKSIEMTWHTFSGGQDCYGAIIQKSYKNSSCLDGIPAYLSAHLSRGIAALTTMGKLDFYNI